MLDRLDAVVVYNCTRSSSYKRSFVLELLTIKWTQWSSIWSRGCLGRADDQIFTSVLTGRTETSSDLSVWRRITCLFLKHNSSWEKLKLSPTTERNPVSLVKWCFDTCSWGRTWKLRTTKFFVESVSPTKYSHQFLCTQWRLTQFLTHNSEKVRDYIKIEDVVNVKWNFKTYTKCMVD